MVKSQNTGDLCQLVKKNPHSAYKEGQTSYAVEMEHQKGVLAPIKNSYSCNVSPFGLKKHELFAS